MIYYRKKGMGKPIILIHGLAGNSKEWRKVEPYLKGHKLVLLDLPGHGNSKNYKRITWKTFFEGIDDVLSKEKIGRAVFVGHSLGGMIALRYYLKNKKKFAGLVMLNSAAYFEKKPEREDFLRGLLNIRFENLEESLGMLKTALSMRPDNLLQITKLSMDFDLRKCFPEAMNIPSLLVSSKHDILFHPHVSRETAELLGSRHVEIDTVHSSTEFRPETVGKEIRRFLKSIKY
jgi:pimeloyl-ACP methyl ester carboxylesterase